MKFLCGLVLLGVGAGLMKGQEVDPFAVVTVPQVDRTNDKDSKEFISDEILKQFDEKRLLQGGENGIIRLTVLRSFHPPLQFTWYVAPEFHESMLYVKRLRMRQTQDDETVYEGMDLNSRLMLRTGQIKVLKTLLEEVDVGALPQDCWQGDGTDGSTWIYEIAGPERVNVIVRRTPVVPKSAAKDVKISAEQLAREMGLTTFALMLWTMSGIDDELY